METSRPISETRTNKALVPQLLGPTGIEISGKCIIFSVNFRNFLPVFYPRTPQVMDVPNKHHNRRLITPLQTPIRLQIIQQWLRS